MKRHGIKLFLALLLLCVSPLLKADTITTFTANGSLYDGTVLGGTLTVDITDGTVVSSMITATGPINAVFTRNAGESHHTYGSGSYDLLYDATADGRTELAFTVSPSFTGFLGGPVNGGNIYYPGSFTYGPNISSLRLSAPTPTPEPSSLLLLGTGIAGAAALRRRLSR